ncbi:multidrug transporter [Solibacillus silvestris]|uniref:multidrug transporter n=1 Tax=Solibacillus silvestris TaxID=76853 RepID=UPI003F7F441A
MFGSLFYNFWAALLSFAVYFILAIQNPYAMPLRTIGASFVVAIIAFGAMFIVRYFLGYIFYTPEALVFSETENENSGTVMEDDNNQQFIPISDRTTTEFEEENTEDIAQVVRTMLHGDEALSQ